MSNIQHSSDTAEHFTPVEIIEAARAVLGRIDLDPASSALANRYVKATKIYTKRSNGFTKRWLPRVFLNPPGGLCDALGRQSAGRVAGGGSSAVFWWGKLAEEYAHGKVTAAIFVGFSLEILQSAQARGFCSTPLDWSFCVPRKRIRFMQAHGRSLVPGNSPTHASAIVYLGIKDALFEEHFSQFGKVIRKRG